MESRVSPLLRPYLSLLILIPDDEKVNRSYLNSIIQTVNAESLESAEVLSDHAYYYSSKEGYIMV